MTHEQDRDAELRERLAANAAEAAALAPDDFSGKHRLGVEADELRAELQELAEPGLAEVADQWAERAGRKGSHEHDPEVAKGAIVSPGEGAGGSG